MSNNDRELTPDEHRYLERARNNVFEDGGIVRYYEQALRMNVHAAVLEAIEVRMRTDFPRAARQVFGAKGDQAVEILSRVRDAVLARFDISGNGLGNHIKVGGDEKGGTATPRYLYRYVSYRGTGQEFGAQLALIQQEPTSELQVMVRYYGVSRNRAKIDEQTWFAIGDIDQAQQMYLDLLEKLAVPRCVQAA
jgi:hypothetical protein